MHAATGRSGLNLGNDGLLAVKNRVDEPLPAIAHEASVVANGFVWRAFWSAWCWRHGTKVRTGAKTLGAFRLENNDPNR